MRRHSGGFRAGLWRVLDWAQVGFGQSFRPVGYGSCSVAFWWVLVCHGGFQASLRWVLGIVACSERVLVGSGQHFGKFLVGFWVAFWRFLGRFLVGFGAPTRTQPSTHQNTPENCKTQPIVCLSPPARNPESPQNRTTQTQELTKTNKNAIRHTSPPSPFAVVWAGP